MSTQPLRSSLALHVRRQRPRSCGPAALERIVWIHEQIGRGETITAEDVARKFEVSSRTIKRDLDLMRDRIGVPIAWDPSERTYHYTRPCDLLPLLRIEADEALALALAGETFAAWRGSALGQALSSALEKVASVVGGAVSVSGDALSKILFAPAEPTADAEHRFFALLLEAIQRRRELSIAYQKPKANQGPEFRTVHPLHLAYLDHRWMLVAYDVKRAACRSFLLARIQAVEWTGRRFEPPAGFRIDAYLSGSVGRFAGTDEHLVRIAVDATAAPYLRERPWHSTQTLVERAGGAIEVTLRLNNLIDIERRVLACGVHVEVLEPRELRESIRAIVAALAYRYGGAEGRVLRDWVATGQP
jgi:predicted DNA-binding transcriptional regulator YafY